MAFCTASLPLAAHNTCSMRLPPSWLRKLVNSRSDACNSNGVAALYAVSVAAEKNSPFVGIFSSPRYPSTRRHQRVGLCPRLATSTPDVKSASLRPSGVQ